MAAHGCSLSSVPSFPSSTWAVVQFDLNQANVGCLWRIRGDAASGKVSFKLTPFSLETSSSECLVFGPEYSALEAYQYAIMFFGE
jgi:hypothetical protein